MRRLIVNADDFGLTQGVNRAIIESHSQGVVTSSTLMAGGSAYDDAVARARATPSLCVGCHVVLVDGKPLTQTISQNTLIDYNAHEMRFHSKLGRVAALATFSRLGASQIKTEVAAQIQKLQADGIEVSHIDTHKHTHMFPQVLRPLLAAARACGVRAIRNPFETASLAQLFRAPRLLPRWLSVTFLRTLRAGFLASVAESGLQTTNGCVGIAATGLVNRRLVFDLIRGLPQGTWELVCHPGYHDSDLRQANTRLLGSREEELRILTAASLQELMKEEEVELISYQDLAR